MKERHISIQKSARYYIHGEPGPKIKNIWIACHGYGYLAGRFIEQLDCLAGEDTVIVCPEGLHRFYLNGMDGKVGASWMTKEDREQDITDYIAYLDDLYSCLLKGLERVKLSVNVLGFSQGTATVCRWLCNRASRADNLILWGGAIPDDLDFATAVPLLNGLNLKLVVGNRDEFIKKEDLDKHLDYLRSKTIEYELLKYDGGHTLHSPTLKNLVR